MKKFDTLESIGIFFSTIPLLVLNFLLGWTFPFRIIRNSGNAYYMNSEGEHEKAIKLSIKTMKMINEVHSFWKSDKLNLGVFTQMVITGIDSCQKTLDSKKLNAISEISHAWFDNLNINKFSKRELKYVYSVCETIYSALLSDDEGESFVWEKRKGTIADLFEKNENVKEEDVKGITKGIFLFFCRIMKVISPSSILGGWIGLLSRKMEEEDFAGAYKICEGAMKKILNEKKYRDSFQFYHIDFPTFGENALYCAHRIEDKEKLNTIEALTERWYTEYHDELINDFKDDVSINKYFRRLCDVFKDIDSKKSHKWWERTV